MPVSLVRREDDCGSDSYRRLHSTGHQVVVSVRAGIRVDTRAAVTGAMGSADRSC